MWCVTVWLQYFEGLNFRSLRVNPLFGNFRGIYFRCMHYDALSLASDRIASYPAVAVVSLLFSCYHIGVKATWEAYSRQNDELLMSLNFFRCAIIAGRWIVVSSSLSEACPAFTDCLHPHRTAGTMASY